MKSRRAHNAIGKDSLHFKAPPACVAQQYTLNFGKQATPDVNNFIDKKVIKSRDNSLPQVWLLRRDLRLNYASSLRHTDLNIAPASVITSTSPLKSRALPPPQPPPPRANIIIARATHAFVVLTRSVARCCCEVNQ
jgi:hypothetical protein